MALGVEGGGERGGGGLEVFDALVVGQRARFGEGEGLDGAPVFAPDLALRAGRIEGRGAPFAPLVDRDRITFGLSNHLPGAELREKRVRGVIGLEAIGTGEGGDLAVTDI